MEKEMVTHSSMIAWKIPWTEEPDGLQSKVLDMTKRLYNLNESVLWKQLLKQNMKYLEDILLLLRPNYIGLKPL